MDRRTPAISGMTDPTWESADTKRRIIDVLPGLLVWLLLIGGLAGYILFETRSRGANMGGTLLMLLSGVLGAISLLTALFPLLVQTGRHRTTSMFVRLVVAASFFGLAGTLKYGKHLYTSDQEEAKQFVEQRIAELSTNAPFPATQDAFINGHPLPHLLRKERFYVQESDGQFSIFISVDWDGGWSFNSITRRWHRST